MAIQIKFGKSQDVRNAASDALRKDSYHANTAALLAGLRRYTVDTAAAVAFFTPISMGVEIGISHMTLMQSVKARIIGNGVNVLTGRPYGMFRDVLSRKLGIDEKSGLAKKAVGDIAAFAVFQVPLYVGILAASGADAKQVKLAVGSAIVASAIVGRPYGVWLEFCRRLCWRNKKSADAAPSGNR